MRADLHILMSRVLHEAPCTGEPSGGMDVKAGKHATGRSHRWLADGRCPNRAPDRDNKNDVLEIHLRVRRGAMTSMCLCVSQYDGGLAPVPRGPGHVHLPRTVRAISPSRRLRIPYIRWSP